ALPGLRRQRARGGRAARGGVEVALPCRPLAHVVPHQQRRALRGRAGPRAGPRLAPRVAHARGDDPRDGQGLRAAAGARLGGRREGGAPPPRVAPGADPRWPPRADRGDGARAAPVVAALVSPRRAPPRAPGVAREPREGGEEWTAEAIARRSSWARCSRS